MNKKAILIVSFGSSYPETVKKTIGKIEEEIQAMYPEYEVYRAWTSGMIRKKIEKRDGIHILSVSEAMEQLHKKGIEEVYVQPTHVLNGIENDVMIKVVEAHRIFYKKVAIGAPLLTSQEDSERLVDLMIKEWKLKEDEMLVFMGHGTEHYANFIYPALNYQFQMRGCENIVVGTVEGHPTVEMIMDMAKKRHPSKVILTPFMIVAGDHANNDLAGEEEDSWKNLFEKAGFEVECVLKGLGEYPEVRQMFQEHIAQILHN